MELKINLTEKPSGDLTAKALFVVTTIDTDDFEDSTTEIWQANDEDHLFDLVKEDYVGDEDEFDEDFISERKNQFDNEWGFEILFEKIATLLA